MIFIESGFFYLYLSDTNRINNARLSKIMPQIKLMSLAPFVCWGRLAKSVKNLSFFQKLSNHIQSKYLCKLAFRSVLGYVRTKKIMSTCFPLFDYWLTLKSIHTYWSSITNTTRDDKYQKKRRMTADYFLFLLLLLLIQSIYFIWLSIFGSLIWFGINISYLYKINNVSCKWY